MKNQFVWLGAILLMFFAQSNAFAQRFGFKGGLNLANIVYEPVPTDAEFEMFPTFNAGYMDLGLVNTTPKYYLEIEDISTKNNVLGINLTWFFAGKDVHEQK